MKHLYFLEQVDLYRPNKKISIGTDCSGIEAPIVALELMGVDFSHKWSCDIDEKALESIRANFEPDIVFEDLMKRNNRHLPKVSIYCAGFPCQSFSHLGMRQGFEDEKNRGLVFFGCYEAIKSSDPTVFILENVKGLLTHDNGESLQTILDYLNGLGDYYVYYSLFNTLDYGLPQHRERLFIIGIKKNRLTKEFRFPKKVDLKVKVSDLMEKNKEITQLTEHKIGLLQDLYEFKISKGNWLVNLNVSNYTRSSPMLDISPCLMAQGAIYYSTKFKRNLTPREFLRLQGFPDSFKQVVSDNQMYKQAGNSMSVCVLVSIFSEIFKCVKF